MGDRDFSDVSLTQAAETSRLIVTARDALPGYGPLAGPNPVLVLERPKPSRISTPLNRV